MLGELGPNVLLASFCRSRLTLSSLASVSASQWNSRYSIGGGGTSVTGGAFDDDVDPSGCGCVSLLCFES